MCVNLFGYIRTLLNREVTVLLIMLLFMCLFLCVPLITSVCLFYGVGSVVVHSLLIVTPIVGFRNCSVFCRALLMSILVLQSS